MAAVDLRNKWVEGEIFFFSNNNERILNLFWIFVPWRLILILEFRNEACPWGGSWLESERKAVGRSVLMSYDF